MRNGTGGVSVDVTNVYPIKKRLPLADREQRVASTAPAYASDPCSITLPGYRLIRQIGHGGMAMVFLAEQQSLRREVALKVMSPALVANPDVGERFFQEAHIAATLRDAHIVCIFDVARVGNYTYIAMEYLNGEPVALAHGKARPARFALGVARDIASALRCVHDWGFVHHDVKTDNILLRSDGSAVLTDFGIARPRSVVSGVVASGVITGSPRYMSPEQAGGGSVDGRSDLYSLGIVLHELLTGASPYDADDSLAIAIMHMAHPIPKLPAPLAHLQPLLNRLLAKDPVARYQTAQDVIDALEQFLAPSFNGGGHPVVRNNGARNDASFIRPIEAGAPVAAQSGIVPAQSLRTSTDNPIHNTQSASADATSPVRTHRPFWHRLGW
jgi:serine/threonine protein kinase